MNATSEGAAMSQSPVFIHSLFRAGSTYLFDVFRRAESNYWCYQEPLHEVAILAKSDPDKLIEGFGSEMTQLIRHPKLNRPYFEELFEAWPAWKDVVSEQSIYGAYFAGQDDQDIGITFWRTLAEAAKGRPVFQECRTSGRIGAIKNRLGGYHIYLMRNPWDQWWSYKVAPYFDAANQLIIHAGSAPQPVKLLLDAFNFPVYEGAGLAEAIAFYINRPLTSEQSYLIFYLLWCLALKEGSNHADILLCIDRLSESGDYQSEIQSVLKMAGIEGVDFSDCKVPQGYYPAKERQFFKKLEGQVHQWLQDGGWTQEDLERIQTLRNNYQPSIWDVPVTNIDPEKLAEQSSRMRDLVVRFETSSAEASAKLREFEVTSRNAEERATQAEELVGMAEDRARQAAIDNAAAQEYAKNTRIAFDSIINSRSWKLTLPLRLVGKFVRWFVRGSSA